MFPSYPVSICAFQQDLSGATPMELRRRETERSWYEAGVVTLVRGRLYF